MERGIITGKDGAFSRNGLIVAHCRNWSLNVSKDVIETTPLNVFDRTYIESLRGATGSVTVLYNDTNPDVRALFNRILANDTANDVFGFILNTATNARLDADVIINSMSIPMSVGEALATNFSFTVNGPISGGF